MKINQITENMSHTAKRIHDIEKEKGVKPGTPEWFKLWFSLPYLKESIDERELTKAEIKKRDDYADDLPDAEFKKRYGKDWEAVKYGTATNMAKGESVEEATKRDMETKGQAEKRRRRQDALAAKANAMKKKKKRDPSPFPFMNAPWMKDDDESVDENFKDGKVKGKSRPGRVKRSGASCDGSVTELRKKAKNSSGEKQKMYHWCANMKAGKKK